MFILRGGRLMLSLACIGRLSAVMIDEIQVYTAIINAPQDFGLELHAGLGRGVDGTSADRWTLKFIFEIPW